MNPTSALAAFVLQQCCALFVVVVLWICDCPVAASHLDKHCQQSSAVCRLLFCMAVELAQV
jgi:hypothetical protein